MDKLESIVQSWIGTPFKTNIGLKGFGTDCIHLISNVLQEYQDQPELKNLPDYSEGLSPDLFLLFYPSRELTEPIKGSVVFLRHGNLSLMTMYLNKYQVLMIHEKVGVTFQTWNYFSRFGKLIYFPLIF